MQAPDPQTNQPSGASPVESSSDIVNLEPVFSSAYVSPPQEFLFLKAATSADAKARLAEFCKDHSQLLLGLLLGIVATLTLDSLNGDSSTAIEFQGLSVNQQLFSRSSALALQHFHQGLAPTLVKVSKPPLTPDPAQPAPQLQFIDRYYFADSSPASGSDPATPAWLMVDRYYFSPQEWPVAGPETQPPTGDGRLNPHPVWSSSVTDWTPPTEVFQGGLTVPPPPDFNLAAVNSPEALPRLGSGSPQARVGGQEQHMLLGVVQTDSFGAALIKTNDSSYSVRIGDTIRQSSYVLTQLDRDKAVLSNGQQTFVIDVGESF